MYAQQSCFKEHLQQRLTKRFVSIEIAGQSDGTDGSAHPQGGDTDHKWRLQGGASGESNSAMPMISAQDAFLRIRARFVLARLMSTEGSYAEAEAISRATVDEATAATLYSRASQGLTDFCHTLTVTRKFDEAEVVIKRAIDLAIKHEAKRAEMRAKMQRASLLYERNEPQAAINQAGEPLKFYGENGFPRTEADGRNIVVRALVLMERYDEAAEISRQVITLAETMSDESLLAVSMEGLAGHLVSQGRLPEALTYQETLEKIYRKQNDNFSLPYALNNRAKILIRLGRGQEGELLLAEVVSKAASGIESFKTRTRPAAVIRAMHATFDRRWKDVGPQAAIAMTLPNPASKPDSAWRWGSVLLEHAKAQQGRPGAPASILTQWIADTRDPEERREIAYSGWADSFRTRRPVHGTGDSRQSTRRARRRFKSRADVAGCRPRRRGRKKPGPIDRRQC